MNNNNLQNQNNQSSDGDNHPDILKLFSKAKETSLTPEEKTAGTLLLKDFMEKNAVGAHTVSLDQTDTKTARKTFYTEYFKNLFVRDPRLVYALAVFVLVFSFATGAVYASQEAIPGDLLYPIKRQVAERVERIAALGTEAKTKVAVKHAVTRLEEIKTLIERNKIDSKNEAALQSDFDHNSKDVEKGIIKLEKEGRIGAAIKISSEFEDKLDKQEKDLIKSLEKIPTELKDKFTSTGSLSEYIKASISVSASIREDLENKLEHKGEVSNSEKSSDENDYSREEKAEKEWNKNEKHRENRESKEINMQSIPLGVSTTASTTASSTVKVIATSSVQVPVSTTNATNTTGVLVDTSTPVSAPVSVPVSNTTQTPIAIPTSIPSL